tara:strand:- start:305 stop:562 length:258 start_codon:yes stop_codon:yes gene_type:complete
MTFTEIIKQLKDAHPEYTRTPSEQYSSARMGGWLLKDNDDLYIGFVSNRGGVQLVDVAETTPENKPHIRGVTNEKYKEFKQRHTK